jgi:aryl-alcohol dehydrogenase-like predicted oxidoreductase
MKYRTLGRSGLSVSEIGVGAWQLGGPLKLDGKTDGHPDLGREHAIDLIRRCGEMGINFIDTAEQYGNGESERRVGEALKGQRDRWIISTKFGAQVGPNGERLNDVSAKRVPISLEGSLRRLQTDYIDVYVYHTAPDPHEAIAVAAFLEHAKRQGKARSVGISTNDLQQIEMLHSLGCLDVVQFAQSMLTGHEELTAFLGQHHIGGVVRGAMAGGRLSGKYFHKAPVFPPDDIRSVWTPPGSEATMDYTRCAVFEELLTPSRSMVQLALRYLLDQPTTHTIILGAKSVAEYRDAIGATELPALTEQEQRRIEELRVKVNTGI